MPDRPKRFVASIRYRCRSYVFSGISIHDSFKINTIKVRYDPVISKGASVIRLKLKISSLKTFGSAEPPPLIRMKPKDSKPMISNKIRYFFFVKIMLFLFSTRQKQKVQYFDKKIFFKPMCLYHFSFQVFQFLPSRESHLFDRATYESFLQPKHQPGLAGNFLG